MPHSKKSLEQIFEPSILNNNTKTKYGFGWFIENTEPFGKIENHSGSWPGYINFIERHTENDKTIILLQNNDNKNICLKTFLILLERTFEIFQLSETKFLNIESKNLENTDENKTKFANPI